MPSLLTGQRFAALALPMLLVALAAKARRPGRRERLGAALATAWLIPALLGANALVIAAGMWRFAPGPGAAWGQPLDLVLGWALAWGAGAALALPHVPVAAVVGIALGLDLLLMPALSPLLELGRGWLVGEAALLALLLVPAQLLARWTRDDRRLGGRVALLAIGFGAWFFGVVPLAILAQTGEGLEGLLRWPRWADGLFLQVLLLAALPGLAAARELASRGLGTPLPVDPTRRLVATGPYAYVRNPMQLSVALGYLVLGLWVRSGWVALAAVAAWVYCAGIARASERSDLEQRFGRRWEVYRSAVRAWWPRWRPWHPSLDEAAPSPPAVLYVAGGCGPCSRIGRWLLQRAPTGLEIVAAEAHPSRDLRRMTYRHGDGGPDDAGVQAFARALTHLHFGWALVGFAGQLPLVGAFLQLVCDAMGGGPRLVPRVVSDPRGDGR